MVLNDIWSSKDGISWTEETASAAFSAHHDQQFIVASRDLWMLGSECFEDDVSVVREVWHSTDGKDRRLDVREGLVSIPSSPFISGRVRSRLTSWEE